MQVYDRWHFVRAVKKQIDACLTSILPSVITLEKEETDQQTFPHETKLQRRQKERAEKKWMMIKSIQQEYKKGKKKAELAREFHMDPRTFQVSALQWKAYEKKENGRGLRNLPFEFPDGK